MSNFVSLSCFFVDIFFFSPWKDYDHYDRANDLKSKLHFLKRSDAMKQKSRPELLMPSLFSLHFPLFLVTYFFFFLSGHCSPASVLGISTLAI